MKRSWFVVVVVLAACVDRGPGPQGKKIDPSFVRNNLLQAPPADIERLDVDLGGRVTYLGNKLAYPDGKDPATPLAPGATIHVIHYWRVMMPPGDHWRVFALLRGAPGTADFMNLEPTDMQLGHPTRKWKAGQIIQDVQEIVLRPDWRSPTATLQVGLVWAGGNQLGDRMPATGANVVDRAIIARTIEVDLAKAPPPPGTVYVPRAAGAITIDGVMNDPGWANAATSADFVTADGSPEPVGKAIARMTWDDQNLYVFVQVTDSDVYSPYKQHDDPLWKADCVELFIDADGNRRGYVELQVNPNNATFDSFFASTRAQPGDESWDANMVTAVRVRGTADKGGDADQGWDVEIAIPLAAVKGRHDSMPVRLPPEVGDKWRLNVVRVDYRSNGGNPGVASWNRISYADFHALDRMLTVVFADPTGSISPSAAPSTAPSATPADSPSATPSASSAPAPAPVPGQPPEAPGSAAAPQPAPGAPPPTQGAVPPSAAAQPRSPAQAPDEPATLQRVPTIRRAAGSATGTSPFP